MSRDVESVEGGQRVSVGLLVRIIDDDAVDCSEV